VNTKCKASRKGVRVRLLLRAFAGACTGVRSYWIPTPSYPEAVTFLRENVLLGCTLRCLVRERSTRVLLKNSATYRASIFPFLVKLINEPILRIAVAPPPPSATTRTATNAAVNARIPLSRRHEARTRRRQDDEEILLRTSAYHPIPKAKANGKRTLKNPKIPAHKL